MTLKNIILTGIFSLLIITSSFSQESRVEVLPDFSDNSRVTLNDQLRRTSRRLRAIEGGVSLTTGVTGVLPLANGGTGQALSDPEGDRIPFWDDSEGKIDWLTANIRTTSLNSFELFTSSGTFIAPVSIDTVFITAVGGGGGSGGSNGSGFASGGGGGGEAIINEPFTVSGGSSYTVTVGAKGDGGANGTTAGTNGGDSIFDAGGSPLTADGGAGSDVGQADQSGGLGGGGSLDASGTTPGTKSFKGGDGSAGVSTTAGAGGASHFGSGGAPDNVGSGFGGGGGGRTDSGSGPGFDGTAGFVLVGY